MEAELYVREMDWSDVAAPHLEVKVWSDANDLGCWERGQYQRVSGEYVPMSIRRDDQGEPMLAEYNPVLVSLSIPLTTPGDTQTSKRRLIQSLGSRFRWCSIRFQ
ncbi:MAG: hypothetical protein VX910_03365 [Candidatus Latescibacterota bacterium]|nr:hypothetical protein [Candidatus Latescibacterota bacterium]